MTKTLEKRVGKEAYKPTPFALNYLKDTAYLPPECMDSMETGTRSPSGQYQKDD